MSDDFVRYTIDPDRIVSEVIDGEAIIVNLANGYYYSLDAPAAEIWAWLQAGWSISAIVSALRRRYDCSDADPEAAVRALIDMLIVDDLVAPGAPAVDPQGIEPLGPAAVEKNLYRPPTLQRFEDMQGFLLVDPIHEVDDTGWPHTRRGESPASRG
jgi:hypothetical protein